MAPICPYCGNPSKLVTGKEIYPGLEYLHHKMFWSCPPCQAYVGCHPGSEVPLGRLANAQLRKAKVAAHQAFDLIWKSGQMSRSKAYDWLSRKLKVPTEECHIDMFDVDMCKKVEEACRIFEKPEDYFEVH